jgi:hypothetical protein
VSIEFADKRDDERSCREARRESARRCGVELSENFDDDQFRAAVCRVVTRAKRSGISQRELSPLHAAIRRACRRPKRWPAPFGVCEAREASRGRFCVASDRSGDRYWAVERRNEYEHQ